MKAMNMPVLPLQMLLLLGLTQSHVEGFVLPTFSLSAYGMQQPLNDIVNSSGDKAQTILEIESHVDWMELLEDDSTKITAVTFTASWCKYCQKFLRKWKRKAVQPHAASQNIQFASVDFSSNKRLCQSLHIAALPTIQLYYQGQPIHRLSCGPKSMAKIQQSIAEHLTLTPAQLQQLAQEFQLESTSAADLKDDFKPTVHLRKRDRLKRKLGPESNPV